MSILYTTRSVCENKYPIEIKKYMYATRKDKMDETMEPKKVQVWKKLPNGPLSLWVERGWGGVRGGFKGGIVYIFLLS